MRNIEFLMGEQGPYEVAGMFIMDLPPPRISEIYRGEVSDMYRQEGYTMYNGILTLNAALSVRFLMNHLTYARQEAFCRGQACIGPYVSSGGYMRYGLGLWEPK
jgi:hypothetical protein